MIKYSFERTEKKYFLTDTQKKMLLCGIADHTVPDEYGEYTLCNIYYDTDDWRLIRTSVEKPAYKEKLRIRSYGVPAADSRVFVEIKKKLDGVVYKRRIKVALDDAELILRGESEDTTQIGREIAYFREFYTVRPRVFIAYDRIAFAGKDDKDLRITLDFNMRWRDEELDLRLGDEGMPIIGNGKTLMEIKLPGACPMWLTKLLSSIHAYPVSFSKYGTCYTEHILRGEHASLSDALEYKKLNNTDKETEEHNCA